MSIQYLVTAVLQYCRMCEVTRDNFESLLPEMCQNIEECSFLAFDCEFTALEPDKSQQRTLFDDIREDIIVEKI